MPFDLKIEKGTLAPYALETAVRRGLLAAGKVTLAEANVLAPKEPVPRHGVHLTETGFVRIEVGLGEDAVAIGYEAFWAVWQEEHTEWNHPHGGQAKFLETALLRSAETAQREVAAAVRAATGAV